MRGCLTLLIGVLIGTILGIGLFVAYQASMAPRVQPIQPSSPSDITIELQDAYLTREASAGMVSPDQKITVKNPRISTREGQTLFLDATFAISTSVGTQQTPGRVQFRPVVRQNRIALDVVEVQISGIEVPSSMFSAMNDQLNQQIGRLFGSTSYRVVSVSTTTDSLVIGLAVGR